MRRGGRGGEDPRVRDGVLLTGLARKVQVFCHRCGRAWHARDVLQMSCGDSRTAAAGLACAHRPAKSLDQSEHDPGVRNGPLYVQAQSG